MIDLAPIDQALLDGAHGEASARAMAILMRYGQAADATRFVSIQSAHIDGCLYHGPSSIDFVRRFVDLGGRVRVPTTLNVAAVDVTHPEWHCGPAELIPAQSELTDLHEQLGCIATLTCAPYQRMLRPALGEHIAWAESNAIVFANSVLGARTDRYGDFADLCAALTGRVPMVGLHCDENRRAQIVVDMPTLDASSIARDLYFAVAGYVLGLRAPGQVPFLRGLPLDSSEDELKALGAAGASSGALALFHVEGVTPEAGKQAIDDLPVLSVTPDDLTTAIASLCPVGVGEEVAAICLGTPHYSIREFRTLTAALVDRRPAPGVAMFVSTSREIAAMVDADPAFAPLRDFGANIVVDACTYVAPVVRRADGAILTTSAKYAHYGPGNIKRRIGLMTLERCLRSAELGTVSP
jgi:predicted aconitase